MLEKRCIAGKIIYRVPGTLIWSYSQKDAQERAKLGPKIVGPRTNSAPTHLSGSVRTLQAMAG
jgi:hypothetical protein